MVLLSQLDVAACREAYKTEDCDAARIKAMLAAVRAPASDEVVLELCSQVAVARPLHAALGDHAASEASASGGGSAGGGSHGVGAGAGSGGAACFEVLMRAIEELLAGAEDAEEDSLLAFAALGGNADGTGVASSKRLRTICKVRHGPAATAAASHTLAAERHHTRGRGRRGTAQVARALYCVDGCVDCFWRRSSGSSPPPGWKEWMRK